MKPYVNLVENIPLSGPLSINIETTNRCNFACSICPTSDKAARARVGFHRQDMPVNLYKKIIDDLREFDTIMVVNHHYMGEPLLNPYFFDMVRYAVDAGISDEHWIRTNGSLLTDSNISKLVDSGLTRVGISIYATDEQGYQDVTGRDDGIFEKVRRNVSRLFDASRGKLFVYAKIIDFNSPQTDPDKFRAIFSPITDECHVEYPMQWNNDPKDTTRGQGVTRGVSGNTLRRLVACPYPVFTLAINSLGKVGMCCFDWSYKTEVGDVTKESLLDIWNGQRVREFWRMHLSGCRSHMTPCRDCQSLNGCAVSLDDHRPELLARLDNE